jgi:alpha-tubulin suppressor-like RCC1 family protein
MSSQLWKYYLQDDVDRFRHLLETASYNVRPNQHRAQSMQTPAAVSSSPGTLSTSPTLLAKMRKPSNFSPHAANMPPLTKADINWRDSNGMTLLHHAASSTTENALEFAQALVEHPLIDLYPQDAENSWTALHRAFYFGNITIARAILERDSSDALRRGIGGGLVKMKDREGLGPLDLYAATIKDRTLRPEGQRRPRAASDASEEEVDMDNEQEIRSRVNVFATNISGDEVYTFGSNKNITLGFGDEDDRQHPERITLKRPDHLLQRFYREHVKEYEKTWATFDPVITQTGHSALPRSLPVESMPWAVKNRPLIIQDVFMSKLSTLVLTTDPESNLYMCGHGPGGRLGVGDEQSRFRFVCVDGGALSHKKIVTVALGQNHTLAVDDRGEVFSWGSNGYGQLGYTLPKTGFKDEDPVSCVPAQIFGPLKREIVIGVAASRIHSVAYTSTSLYTFGKNEGQLGIVDSDARSLEFQVTPRKVAASRFAAPIVSVAAIDRATVCLLENHDVWVFANYGYAKIQFPLDGSNSFLKDSFRVTRYDDTVNHVSKITAGGDTICAMSSSGEVYTLSVSQRQDQGTASTTNPTKIRGALSTPQEIWSLKKNNMAARDVGVDADGSIILTTEEGSVWKRSRRTKIKDGKSLEAIQYKPKDYKFSRIAGLSRVTAVRSSAYGAYAAVRRDCDVTKTQTLVEEQNIWSDLFPLLCFHDLSVQEDIPDSESEEPQPRFWQGRKKLGEVQLLRKHLLQSKDIEKDLEEHLQQAANDNFSEFDVIIASNVSDMRFPAHQFILAGRSRVLRAGLQTFNDNHGGGFSVHDLLIGERDSSGRPVLIFQGLDTLTLVDFLLYCYTDTIVDFWHHTRGSPKAFRYRQVRTELMKVAAKLELLKLEPAVRQMIEPERCLHMDFEIATRDQNYFANGDIRVQLSDGEVLVHGAMVCQRCPFFEGMFMGRAGGRWLEERRGLLQNASDAVDVDLQHIESDIFHMVLRHIYADTGEELFDDIVSADLDEFLDVVMEVMAVANELMLDRLSQVCQRVVGQHVTTRNVCGLLNAIAPSSVTEFKDASLEYLCLSLEAMLQGGLLDELEEDLLLELDDIVRANQLALMPFAKSGRAEALLHERHPELAALIDRDRRIKLDSIMLHSKYQDLDGWGPNSFRGGSLDDGAYAKQKARRKSKDAQAAAIDSTPRTKAAVPFLGTSIEESSLMDSIGAQSNAVESEFERALRSDTAVGTPTESWLDARGKSVTPHVATPKQSGLTPGMAPATPASSSSVPWAATPSPGAKLEMRDIMAQASSSRVSNLSLGIAASREKASEDASAARSAAKMSQKERKRMQQVQQTAVVEIEEQIAAKVASPWQVVSGQKIPSLKDVIGEKPPSPGPSHRPQPVTRPSNTPQLTMRQTIANPRPSPKPSAAFAASPKSLGPGSPITSGHPSPRLGPQRVPSTQNTVKSPAPVSPHTQAQAGPSLPVRPTPTPRQSQPQSQRKPSQQTIASTLAPPPPPDLTSRSFPSIQSVVHNPRVAEPALQLSLQEILEQQQYEKDIIKEAAAARSLQEIQAEQEFQEWWDKEAARMKEDEEFARLVAEGKTPELAGAGKKKGGKRGGKQGQEKKKDVPQAQPISQGQAASQGHATPQGQAPKPRGGRGRGRGGAAVAHTPAAGSKA